MAADRGDSVPVLNPCIVGRSSSRYTRLARIFALELDVVCDFSPVYDLASRNPADYAGNPALKLPVLTLGETAVFGAENICRTLAEKAHGAARVAWTEDLPGAQARNAQELVWHAMQAQVQLVFGTQVAKLPAENVYFEKAATGLRSALAWLDGQVDNLQHALPPVLDSSGNRNVYLPPGQWLDFLPASRIPAAPRSPRTTRSTRRRCSFARARSSPSRAKKWTVYGSGQGHFDLYEDDGI